MFSTVGTKSTTSQNCENGVRCVWWQRFSQSPTGDTYKTLLVSFVSRQRNNFLCATQAWERRILGLSRMNIVCLLQNWPCMSVIVTAEESFRCQECVGFMWLCRWYKHNVKCQSCLPSEMPLWIVKKHENHKPFLSLVFQKLTKIVVSLAKYAWAGMCFTLPQHRSSPVAVTVYCLCWNPVWESILQVSACADPPQLTCLLSDAV